MTFLHIITLDKFTKGFIDFINSNFDEKVHYFFVYGQTNKYMFEASTDNVYFINNYHCLAYNRDYRKIVHNVDRIIVNGLFGAERCFLFLGKNVLKKTYLMFWGADMYTLKNKTTLKMKVNNAYKKYIIKNSDGVINLIKGDYKILLDECITPRKHFIAPMASDSDSIELFKVLNTSLKKENPYIIMVGNSATETNCHFQIFDLLKRFKEENIELICPLSYGKDDYAKKVIKKGKEIFGNSFHALTDFISINEFYELMSNASVCLYNNNRQQAMGNINSGLALGCKVYIRNDTVMWEHYNNLGFSIFNIEDIENMSFEEFIYFSSTDKSNNFRNYSKNYSVQSAVDSWKIVFNSVKEDD